MTSLAAMQLCGLSIGANAQALYRCGNEYSQTRCLQAWVVDEADPRTAEKRAEVQCVPANEPRRVADL